MQNRPKPVPPHRSEWSATLIALRPWRRDDQMSQFERVYKIDRLLPGRVPPTKQRILEAIEVSEPTLRRDLEYMRSWLGASVTPDR